ncbi:hypothetical protein EXIGLDRAFT_691252 [Exidia glandulosa HHB12029]|uniref:SnoaL-like domain-containing protein n=1 Tax=Exidia glandulosa HHB12029 TaxID=1314781 RepID=A0A165IT82_EXIGL|nr:hypothetical protein EXIGLDRAFT_691252 [Exidia glandulosa HHB12029]
MSADSTSDEKAAALALCKSVLDSLSVGGPEGRAQMLAGLAFVGTACHGRRLVGKSFEHEAFPNGFVDRIPWSLPPGTLVEGLDGEPTVLVDHDLAMVWTPYWVRVKGELSHVGTNCFTLIKEYWDEDGRPDKEKGKLQWKICGMTDTGRTPTEEDKRRLG